MGVLIIGALLFGQIQLELPSIVRAKVYRGMLEGNTLGSIDKVHVLGPLEAPEKGAKKITDT